MFALKTQWLAVEVMKKWAFDFGNDAGLSYIKPGNETLGRCVFIAP